MKVKSDLVFTHWLRRYLEMKYKGSVGVKDFSLDFQLVLCLLLLLPKASLILIFSYNLLGLCYFNLQSDLKSIHYMWSYTLLKFPL